MRIPFANCFVCLIDERILTKPVEGARDVNQLVLNYIRARFLKGLSTHSRAYFAVLLILLLWPLIGFC